MMIHEVTVKVGPHKKRKRVGRGMASGHGKTCGRGHNGAGSRSGATGSNRASNEGGQMPFFRRIPKRGFTNAMFKKHFDVINIKALEDRFNEGDTITNETLVKVGLIKNTKNMVKILGEGELSKKLTIDVAAVSKSAQTKIESAGGSVKSAS